MATGSRDGDAVDARGVGRTFGTGPVAVQALHDLDLRVPHGQLVVLLGPSGSGKTTLLNLVGAIDEPTAGRLTVDGVDLDSLDADGRTEFRRDHVGFVFQFFNLVPTLTALENVQLVCELTGRAPGAAATAALEAVGLRPRLHSFPGTLSGGEQQRVAVARALAKEPDLLLADEPTGSLDLDTGRQVLGLLRQLNRERGLTVILVTHNSAIAEMADRVLHLRDGTIAEDELNPDPKDAEALRW